MDIRLHNTVNSSNVGSGYTPIQHTVFKEKSKSKNYFKLIPFRPPLFK